MKYLSLILVRFIATGITFGNGAKILFYSGFSTYSHRIAVWPLVEALAERGHDVTYFSTIPNKNPNPNITEFVPRSIHTFFNGAGVMNTNFLHTRFENKMKESWAGLPDFAALLCEVILKSPDTKEFVTNSEFDLVIIDQLFNDCAYGLVHKFGAKHIIFGTNSLFMWNYDSHGLIPESSWIPDLIQKYPQDMNLWQRIVSTIEPLKWHFVREWSYFPKLEKIIKKELGLHDLPSLANIQRNASLFLSNMHYSDEYARSLPPYIVPVGGLHLAGKEKTCKGVLPQNMADFIDESGDAGFGYISFGTETKISTLPRESLDTFFNALRKSKLRFIWKWEKEAPEDAPNNILFVPWAPQRLILASPKIRLFITHGGLLGIHEAIEQKVPMIVFPIFAEQDFNAERVHRNGYGIQLEITDFTETQLSGAIESISTDSSFKTHITRVSETFKDRITNPLETAIWHTEFVLRHSDTSFLKPGSINQTWYERRLLDVWAVIFTLVFLGSLSTTALVKYVLYGLLERQPQYNNLIEPSLKTERSRSVVSPRALRRLSLF